MIRFLTAIALMFSAAIQSATVYKTVGEDGVVSFSDIPPKSDVATEIMEVTAPSPQSVEAHLEQLSAMREVTDRLASDRREREKHRAELKALNARTQTYEAPAQPAYRQYSDYYPSSIRRYRRTDRYPWFPGHGPKPVHPIVRPPLLSGLGGAGSSNSQLMRPMLSTRGYSTGRH